MIADAEVKTDRRAEQVSAWLIYQWIGRRSSNREMDGESGTGMTLPAVIATPFVMFIFNYTAFSQTIPHLVTMAVFEVQRSLLGISFQRFQTLDADVASEFAVTNRWR